MSKAMNLKNKSHFGNLVVNKLEEMGKNQKYLSQEVGLTQVSVYKLLKGETIPTVKNLYLISKALGLGIDELTRALFDES